MERKTHGVGGHAPHIGNSATAKCSWRLLERTSIVECPDWIGGAHVDWMDKYSNPPDLRVKQLKDPPPFEPWKNLNNGEWTRTTADKTLLKRHIHRGSVIQVGPNEWETTKQEGYGGRTFTITPVEGYDTVHLRGPWHGGPPADYEDIYTVDMRRVVRPEREWYDNIACYGLFAHNDLLIAIYTKYLPELPLAWVRRHGGREHIEPMKPEWSAPKGFA